MRLLQQIDTAIVIVRAFIEKLLITASLSEKRSIWTDHDRVQQQKMTPISSATTPHQNIILHLRIAFSANSYTFPKSRIVFLSGPWEPLGRDGGSQDFARDRNFDGRRPKYSFDPEGRTWKNKQAFGLAMKFWKVVDHSTLYSFHISNELLLDLNCAPWEVARRISVNRLRSWNVKVYLILI